MLSLWFSLFSAYVDRSSLRGGTAVRVCLVSAVELGTLAQRTILQMMSTARLRTATADEARSSYLDGSRGGTQRSVSVASPLHGSCFRQTGKCTVLLTVTGWCHWWAEPLCRLHRLADCFLRYVSDMLTLAHLTTSQRFKHECSYLTSSPQLYCSKM